MKLLVSAVIAASLLILAAGSFAAQANGPRALERVVQQNEKYERDHVRPSPVANGGHKTGDQSIDGPNASGDAR